MKKYTVGEILKTRKIGNIGKHSILQDVINEFGEPGNIRWDGLVSYSDIYFEISRIKKRINAIGLSYHKNLSMYYKNLFGKTKIVKDFDKVKKMSIDELKDYLRLYNIEIYTNEIIQGGNADTLIRFIPVDNKYFTIYEPKFSIDYDTKENCIRCIYIDFNYRSKRRD